MKKKIVAATLALGMITGMSTTAFADGYEFTFVCPIVGLEYWDMCADGIKAADEEFGTSTQIIGPSDATTFVSELPNYIDAAISAQPDGIMAYCGIEFMTSFINKADEMGIPMVAIDSDAVEETPRIAYVGTMPYNAGYCTGETMLELTGGEGKLAVLCSGITSEKEMAELDAFKDACKDSNLEIVAIEETAADLATGVDKMQALIQTYPDLVGVYCTSAYDVQAAAKVKEERGLDDLVLVGFDDQEETLNYIRKGVIDAICVQDPYQMGYQSVKVLKDYLDGVELESDEYDTGVIMVNAENVDSYRD